MFDVNLSACNVRAAEAEGKRKYIFQLNISEEESLHFNADTKESLQRWLEVISVATTSRRENSLALSEDELDKAMEVSRQTTCTSLFSHSMFKLHYQYQYQNFKSSSLGLVNKKRSDQSLKGIFVFVVKLKLSIELYVRKQD